LHLRYQNCCFTFPLSGGGPPTSPAFPGCSREEYYSTSQHPLNLGQVRWYYHAGSINLS
jgi:hypothetical protein